MQKAGINGNFKYMQKYIQKYFLPNVICYISLDRELNSFFKIYLYIVETL